MRLLQTSSHAFLLTLALGACQSETDSGVREAPLTKAQQDERDITDFCNVIAAEMVSNPGSTAPLQKLRQKHMEEEWSFKDVDRICSAAIDRKTRLMNGGK